MTNAVELWEKPIASEIYMIAGWRQWADAGSISSGLPSYLIQHLDARKIGQIKPDPFYLFQIPGTQALLRPEIKLAEGYRKELRPRSNNFYYTGDSHKGLVIFVGEEPHMNVDGYAEAFFSAAKALGVRRICGLGGVYGTLPYDKDRSVSCTYSLLRLKPELDKYAVHYSDYQGGVSIGSYLLDKAEKEEMEYFCFYGFVPAYDFGHFSPQFQGIRIENDFRAWHEIMRRLNFMFELGMDLSDLDQKSEDLVAAMEKELAQLEHKMPQLKVREYLRKVDEAFKERPFMPLDDLWAEELGDLFKDLE